MWCKIHLGETSLILQIVAAVISSCAVSGVILLKRRQIWRVFYTFFCWWQQHL